MRYIISRNPATVKINKKIKVSSRKDIDNAVKRARNSLRSWIDTPLKTKIRIMKKFANLILREQKEISKLITKEMGKPLGESESTIPFISEFINYYANNVESVLKPQKVGSDIVIREPVGIVAVITPWNFPFYTSLDIIIPALLTGNTVVFKPSETTPLCGIKIVNLLITAGIPKGVVNLVIGADEQGKYLVKNDVNMVSFVGSSAAGKNIMKNSADKLHHLCLELGGKDAAIICKDVDLKKYIKAIIFKAFRNCGQVCNSIERLYVVKDIADKFIKQAIKEVKKIKVGPGLEKGTIIGPLVNKQQFNNFDNQIKNAVKKGAKVLYGGKSIKGLFYQPTILTNIKDNMKIANQETFGPVLPIIIVKDEKTAIKKANKSRFGLTASVWTRNIEKGKKYARLLDVGTVGINHHGGGGYKVPWGGWKESGFGRLGSKEGIKQFTQTKTIVINK
jgi:acyl-CoA reductase-like NAD-dependent aldehyde dehydrogenase